MASDQQDGTPATAGETATTGAAAPKRRRWPWIVLSVVVAVLAIGGGIGLYAYDKATEPDRSTPVVSADGFLGAVFLDKSPVRVGLYTCSSWSAADALSHMKGLVDPTARVSWDSFASTPPAGGKATVTVRLRLQYEGEIAPSDEEQWTLSLANQDGWRVCRARPTATS